MKKLSLLALAFLITTAAFAQDRSDRVSRGPIVRINVGDDRDDREMLKRIVMLERAVMDLQIKVYELQTQPTQIKEIYCVGNFFGVAGKISSKAPTELEARDNVLKICARNDGGIFCKNADIVCQSN